MNTVSPARLPGKSILKFLDLLYHSVVRDVRKSDGNALMGLAKEILQASLLVIFFYVLITFLNMRSVSVRGSFIVYVMTGVFLFLTHIKAIGKVLGSGGPTNPLLKHAPVTTLLIISSTALSALYIQLLAVGAILFITHVMIEPVYFYDFRGVAGMFFMAWISGVSVGLVFLSLNPFMPGVISIVAKIYQRANMIFSGKMFLANTLPSVMLPFFTWNPLFHAIDQARGYAFINYVPRNTSLMYPIYFTLAFVVIGMMFEHWGRKYASESWNSRR
jgi:ABC-type polysaccharide/polyol phosphate export permease